MDSRRLTRYGLTGAASLLTHLTVLLLLVESAGWSKVPASTVGFIASIGVSFALQHRWVFQHDHPVARTLPRFLAVTTIGLVLNALIMGVGSNALGFNYLLVQAVAFVAIPISNYLLNRQWTFAAAPAFAPSAETQKAPIMPTSDRRWLAFIIIAFTAPLFAAVLHLDLARDLATSFDMINQGTWILVGPQLAAVFNLGPIWYYLLAALQSVGLGVAGTVVVLTLLAALKFPLIYRAGERWIDRHTGLLWAGLLLMPGWHSFEQILITHPILTGLTLAMTTAFGLRFVERGLTRDLVLMSLSFSLALHAHPSTLVIVLLPVGLYALGVMRNHPFRPIPLMLALLAALLPFIPYLIDQQLSGWPVIDGLSDFQSGQAAVISLANVLVIGEQLLGGGLHYLLSITLAWPDALSLAASSLFALTCLVGLSGSILLALRGDAIARILWLAFLSGWIGLMALRVVHPYYMLTPLGFVMAGLVAGGLSFWIARTRRVTISLMACAIILQLAFASAAIQAQHQGSWPFAFNPMMDIKQPKGVHRPHAFLSAMAARKSGRWLCRNPGLAVHGSYALAIIHSYAMDAQLQCQKADVIAGGSDPNMTHVVGLPASLLDQHPSSPIAQIGPFEVHAVVATPLIQTGVRMNEFRDYPPFVPAFNPERLITVELDDHSGHRLAVTHLGFALSRRPVVQLQCDDRVIPAAAVDNTSWIFRLPECSGALSASISISSPEHIDVVVF